jgi:hypothetical protein
MNLHFHSYEILLDNQLLLVTHSKSNFADYNYPDMAFKEIYCNDCGESLGEYSQRYFSKGALHDVIILSQKSPMHRHHDISIRDSKHRRKKTVQKYRRLNETRAYVLSVPVQFQKYLTTALHSIA